MNITNDINILSLNFIVKILIFSIFNYLLLEVYIKFSTLIKFLDIPNKRSSHIKATPKGAGIVFSITSIFFII